MEYNERFWIKFFENAGIAQGFCRRYAEAFVDNRMKPDMLSAVNVGTLRDVGVGPVGDCILIMKYGKRFCQSGFPVSPMAVGSKGALAKPSPSRLARPAAALPASFLKPNPAPRQAGGAGAQAPKKNLLENGSHPGVRLLMMAMNELKREMVPSNAMDVDKTPSRRPRKTFVNKRVVNNGAQSKKSVFQRLGKSGRIGSVIKERVASKQSEDVFSRLGKGKSNSNVFNRLGNAKPTRPGLGIRPRGAAAKRRWLG